MEKAYCTNCGELSYGLIRVNRIAPHIVPLVGHVCDECMSDGHFTTPTAAQLADYHAARLEMEIRREESRAENPTWLRH